MGRLHNLLLRLYVYVSTHVRHYKYIYTDYYIDLDPRCKDVFFKDCDNIDIDAETIMNDVVSTTHTPLTNIIDILHSISSTHTRNSSPVPKHKYVLHYIMYSLTNYCTGFYANRN